VTPGLGGVGLDIYGMVICRDRQSLSLLAHDHVHLGGGWIRLRVSRPGRAAVARIAAPDPTFEECREARIPP